MRTWCVAVSVTGDPTGAYYRYAFDYGDEFPDYPKMSVWPDGYYVTYNIFGGADENTFLGARTCALQRSSMLQGAVAVQQCFLLSDTASLLPADLDGRRCRRRERRTTNWRCLRRTTPSW